MQVLLCKIINQLYFGQLQFVEFQVFGVPIDVLLFGVLEPFRDCPLAGKHLKQLEVDTNISNDEALHPIELMAKSYNL